MKIGLISDTHSHLDKKIGHYFLECDEIWHAGDIGNIETAEKLENIKPVRAVYGNIDGHELRRFYPEKLVFTINKIKFCIIHIGGYPNRYAKGVREWLIQEKPDVFICGHSHILKVMRDKKLNNLLCMNPGAAGIHGFHKVRTIMRFDIEEGRLSNLEVVELGSRTGKK